MGTQHGDPLVRGHNFLGSEHSHHERRLWWVVALTTGAMGIEIAAGIAFGSMALLADGWHMATHAGALSIGALAYAFARRRVDDPRFVFGTGKVGDLAAYTSALALLLAALWLGAESAARLFRPEAIRFDEAILVAVFGLLVNLVSARLLWHPGHHHGGHHGGAHGAGSGGHGHEHPSDGNLRAAYLHVVADALTSLIAIGALLAGRIWGWQFLDPVGGLLGALVILRWSLGLLRDSGAVLLDVDRSGGLREAVRLRVEQGQDRLLDQHVWRLGPGHFGAILTVASPISRDPGEYRARLADLAELAHVTVEVRVQASQKSP